MFRKVLIANRGEIAVRVIRAARELGLSTVAVYSECDRVALHVRMADEAYALGPSPSRESYLAIDKILHIAGSAGVDAIHPGYGFLAENSTFAQRCREAGICFVGPSARSMEMMGEKIAARKTAVGVGVPVVPGTENPVRDVQEAQDAAVHIGFPLLIKAAAGGGGKGMRLVERLHDLASALRDAQSEALAAFGDSAVYIEKYIDRPRHIEFQILADRYGNVIHLGERECSIQRRHQKVIEECPSPLMTNELRQQMGQAAVRIADSCGYENAGTIEFLVDAQRNFYFLEMNTRLQVEHPITELVAGIDLVKEQFKMAWGDRLELRQEDVCWRGAALECRICAEDPENQFFPSPGMISFLRTPSGPGVRDDSGIYEGWTVPVYYDPLLSKLITFGTDRNEAIARMRRALLEYQVSGIKTNLHLLESILSHEKFISGELSTDFIGRYYQSGRTRANHYGTLPEIAAIAAALHKGNAEDEKTLTVGDAESPVEVIGEIRGHEKQAVNKKFSFEALISKNTEMLRFDWNGNSGTVSIGDRQFRLDSIRYSKNCYSLLVDGQSFDISVHKVNDACQVLVNGEPFEIVLRDPKRLRKDLGAAEDSAGPISVSAPMPGKVVKLLVQIGATVQEGQGVAVVEAMKMQNELKAPKSGVVEKILVEENQPVNAGESLLIVR